MADIAFMECAIEEGSSSDDLDEHVPTPRVDVGLRRPARVVGAIISIVGVFAYVYTLSWQHGSMQDIQATSRVTLFAPLALAASISQGLKFGAAELWNTQGIAAMQATRRNVRNSKPLDLHKFANLTSKDLIPKEHRHDGNVCADDEENFGGLCYKTCHSLTAGVYPLRMTAWSCCMQQPCTFMNSKFTSPLSLCGGYDVSGSRENKDCPHVPGTCLVNEEFNLGFCFKKCAILTNNTFPFRSAAGTCCRYNSHWACLDALNTRTSSAFDVGGGIADGDKATPNSMHAPIQNLTEG